LAAITWPFEARDDNMRLPGSYHTAHRDTSVNRNYMPGRVGLRGLIWLTFALLAACTTPPAPAPGLTTTAIPSVTTEVGQTTTLTVFAAASLTDAFREIGQAFEMVHPGSRVIFNFAGSQQLALQIEQGAEADVFASADQRHMDRLVAAGVIASDTLQVFAHNRLVVILPGDNPGQVETLKDLARPGLKLVLAGEQVPAGNYARQVLDKLATDLAYGPSFKEAVLHNVVSNEENVKQVVAKVQLGEADAGIVYQSDLAPSSTGQLRQIDIPDRFNVTASYPIAVLKAAPHASLAHQFVQFVLAQGGQRILQQWGFSPAAK
jgi:molybdate transport system substrate-binding protein